MSRRNSDSGTERRAPRDASSDDDSAASAAAADVGGSRIRFLRRRRTLTSTSATSLADLAEAPPSPTSGALGTQALAQVLAAHAAAATDDAQHAHAETLYGTTAMRIVTGGDVVEAPCDLYKERPRFVVTDAQVRASMERHGGGTYLAHCFALLATQIVTECGHLPPNESAATSVAADIDDSDDEYCAARHVMTMLNDDRWEHARMAPCLVYVMRNYIEIAPIEPATLRIGDGAYGYAVVSPTIGALQWSCAPNAELVAVHTPGIGVVVTVYATQRVGGGGVTVCPWNRYASYEQRTIEYRMRTLPADADAACPCARCQSPQCRYADWTIDTLVCARCLRTNGGSAAAAAPEAVFIASGQTVYDAETRRELLVPRDVWQCEQCRAMAPALLCIKMIESVATVVDTARLMCDHGLVAQALLLTRDIVFCPDAERTLTYANVTRFAAARLHARAAAGAGSDAREGLRAAAAAYDIMLEEGSCTEWSLTALTIYADVRALAVRSPALDAVVLRMLALLASPHLGAHERVPCETPSVVMAASSSIAP